MKLLKVISLCALFLLVITSCSDSEKLIVNNFDISRYSELEKSLTSDYAAFANGLRSRNSNFNDKSSLTAVASEYFGKLTDRYSAFIDTYENVKGKDISRITSAHALTGNQKEKIEEIISSIGLFDNSTDFKLYLSDQFKSIADSDINSVDKDFLLSYIISYKVTLDFIENNLDLIETEKINGRVNKEDSSWWKDWGKCAAGIVGSAVTTGATLGLGGAVVGTVALPVVGTVSGAVVGAVAGAIGGALVGAATFCD